MGAAQGRAIRTAYDEADALRTERNAAVAEAKLWLRRLGQMQRERDEALANLHACDKCLGEWQAAYEEIRRDYWRMESKLHDALFDLDSANFLLAHLDPYLPRWLQTHRQPENELLYQPLAPYRADDAGPE